jgi:hypothetical protein
MTLLNIYVFFNEEKREKRKVVFHKVERFEFSLFYTKNYSLANFFHLGFCCCHGFVDVIVIAMDIMNYCFNK